MELATLSSTAERYFEGNLLYSDSSAFFEESISGVIIPVDMTGLSYMIDTEYPLINENKERPIHVKLSGYLSSQPNEQGNAEPHLTIQKIKDIKDTKCAIQPMVGIYSGNGQTLTIAPNHTYTLQSRSGSEKRGSWFLHSGNTMILLSADSKTVMRINYKKKSLNGKDDNPTIFTLSSNLSNQ